MKKLMIVAVIMCGMHVNAQDSGFGAGLMLGSPTGISVKYWLSGDRALDGGLAWGVWHSGYVHLHADYLFHNNSLITVSKGKLPLYYGPGLRVRSWTGDEYWHHGKWHETDGGRVDIGVRFPVGLAYLFEGAPVDVFLELAPTLDLTPSTGFEIDGAFGARYWF